MNAIDRLRNHLETRWVAPAYGSLVLGGIALCFFGAATNTMAGWLYAISGAIAGLLILGAILPAQSLSRLVVRRSPIAPVSVGDRLSLELQIENPTDRAKTLLQVCDRLPHVLSQSPRHAIEVIPPQKTHRWFYSVEAQRRGVYRWHDVQVKTAAPLGLFWCRRDRAIAAKAIVYPTVLPLAHCPLVDTIGREESVQASSNRRYQAATEGVTRTLRPYRQGDPTRLIHWRTSARLGEFYVRELEIVTSGQELIICLDTAATWDADCFEQAVIAAASLYFYAGRAQLKVRLWTASTGLIQGNRVVLETLAATQPGETPTTAEIPPLPLIWLTPHPDALNSLPANSRWLLFSPSLAVSMPKSPDFPGFVVELEKPLAPQLQRSLR
ncbi:DUF58 domain-containing protein [Lusitaniella coriacea]|uniref:DUF58 domain-containing protein n=1 Tax=Lusitaniella coriacea TaxID=1983105 RepID=UPI003CE735FE